VLTKSEQDSELTLVSPVIHTLQSQIKELLGIGLVVNVNVKESWHVNFVITLVPPVIIIITIIIILAVYPIIFQD